MEMTYEVLELPMVLVRVKLDNLRYLKPTSLKILKGYVVNG